jgi:hypothetical protein
MQHILVDIAPDGSVKIDAVGFTGADCEAATAFLETALGRIGERRTKPEYHSRRVHGSRSQRLQQ